MRGGDRHQQEAECVSQASITALPDRPRVGGGPWAEALCQALLADL